MTSTFHPNRSKPVPTVSAPVATRKPENPPPAGRRKVSHLRMELTGRVACDVNEATCYGVETDESQALRFQRRQNALPSASGYPSCNYVGNDVLSCYPLGNSTLVQGEWSKFIWNAQYPTFIGAGYVDIYLFSAESGDQITSYTGVANAQGMISIRPDDVWWPTESSFTGNQTFTYYFVVVDGNTTLTGGEAHQSTFTAVQTAAPQSLVSASLSSVSSASVASLSSASAASASSASAASASSASMASLSSASATPAVASQSTANRALSTESSASPSTVTSGSASTQVLSTRTGISGSLLTVTERYSATATASGAASHSHGLPTYGIVLLSVLLPLFFLLLLLLLLLALLRRRKTQKEAPPPSSPYGARETLLSNHSSPIIQPLPDDLTPAQEEDMRRLDELEHETLAQHAAPISEAEATGLAERYRQALKYPTYKNVT